MRSRRRFFQAAATLALASHSAASGERFRAPSIQPVLAPSNLGLRPLTLGHEPGAWRAPTVLTSAGLFSGLDARDPVALHRPAYSFVRQEGTSIRNGITLRSFSEDLGKVVGKSLRSGDFPVVVGGDCSILLGCMLGAREGGRCGLIHVDGHSDFYHPGNYDSRTTLGTAAGMDLALVTGRGDKLLTQWPGAASALVADADVVQVGDRDAGTLDDFLPKSIRRIDIVKALGMGPDALVEHLERHLVRRRIERAWIHLDLDVLDQSVMPAVDSPGSPGFDFQFLETLMSGLLRTSSVIGLDIAIYDPEHDPGHRYARAIADCLRSSLRQVTSRQGTQHARI